MYQIVIKNVEVLYEADSYEEASAWLELELAENPALEGRNVVIEPLN